MRITQEICHEMAVQYGERMLLHGEFHHANILLDHDGAYRIIDHKGVIVRIACNKAAYREAGAWNAGFPVAALSRSDATRILTSTRA